MWLNRLELTNEYLVLTDCYFLFTYSDGLLNKPNPGFPEYDEMIPDVEGKLLVGWVNIGFLGSLVLLNISIMLFV